MQTSPFGHLVPPISSLLFHPYNYIYEWLQVTKLHMLYRTDLVTVERNKNMLDTQKRRIYRRAHGMEDLTRAEDQGIDVRGIVPWDDGLTPVERANGGRREPWKLVPGGGSQMYDPMYQKIEPGPGNTLKVVEKYPQAGDAVEGEVEPLTEEMVEAPHRLPRKVKRWFGIWE